MDYEYTPLYYAHPVQVSYFDFEKLKHKEGIAFHEFIVRAVDGKAFYIEEIINGGRANNFHEDLTIIEQEWVNFEPTIS